MNQLNLSDDELEEIQKSLLSMLDCKRNANYFIIENDYNRSRAAAYEQDEPEYLNQAQSIKKDLDKIVKKHKTAQSFLKRIVEQAKRANQETPKKCGRPRKSEKTTESA